MAIHYRIELNPLTKSASYKLRFMPQGTAGYDEVAKRVAQKTMVLNNYDGSLVDILDVRMG